MFLKKLYVFGKKSLLMLFGQILDSWFSKKHFQINKFLLSNTLLSQFDSIIWGEFLKADNQTDVVGFFFFFKSN